MIAANEIAASSKVTYTIPVFPYVGNAIITEKDSSGNVLNYFAAPATNKYAASTYTNENTISGTPYKITKAEAENSVGEVTADGNSVKIDSQKTGTTFLKGTITCTDENIQLDASNSEVYTYVMWNPIENASASDARDGFVALEGQKVSVKATLQDKNGNRATVKNVGITFKDDKGTIISAKGTKVGSNYTGKNYASISAVQAEIVDITNGGTTDVNGQVSLELKADSICDIAGLVAESSDSKYDVVLMIGDKTVEKADIYWLTESLRYESQVQSGGATGDTSATGEDAVAAATQTYKEKENWEIGVKVANPKGALLAGTLAGKTIEYKSGITIATKAGDNSVGTVTVSDAVNGMTTVTSDKSGVGSIINTIDKSSVGSVVWNIQYGADLNNVGIGDSTVNEKLTVNYQYGEVGNTIVNATPILVADGSDAGTFDVYVKLQNKITGAAVDSRLLFSVDDDNNADTLCDVTLNTAADETDGVPTTDGFAKTTVKWTGAIGADKSFVVSVKDKNDSSVTGSVTLKLTKDAIAPMLLESASYTSDTITLNFNKDVDPNTVNKKAFGVTFDSKEYTASIDKVSVDGKKIIVTMKGKMYDGIVADTTAAVVKVDLGYDEDTVSNVNPVYDVKAKDGGAIESAFLDSAGDLKVTITATSTVITDSAGSTKPCADVVDVKKGVALQGKVAAETDATITVAKAISLKAEYDALGVAGRAEVTDSAKIDEWNKVAVIVSEFKASITNEGYTNFWDGPWIKPVAAADTLNDIWAKVLKVKTDFTGIDSHTETLENYITGCVFSNAKADQIISEANGNTGSQEATFTVATYTAMGFTTTMNISIYTTTP